MKKQKSILLIDDDEIFIFLTSKLLQSTGLVSNIRVSSSAIEAIRFLRSVESPELIPDVILLDLNMPDMNGWEFLQHYQSILPYLAKVPSLYVVSSSIADNDTSRALKINGVTGYISKPINTEAIKKIL